MSNFPTHPDQLSTDWLSSALGRPISDFTVEHLGEGAGLLQDLNRRVRDVKQGPDGNLYLLNEQGSLVRLAPAD